MAINRQVREIATMSQNGTNQQMSIITLVATSALICLSGNHVNVNAFPAYRLSRRQPITITSTSRFAGGGFGASKSKTPSKKKTVKTKKPKSKLLDVAANRPSSNSGSQATPSPPLDRFGLPIPTEEDIFPPLDSAISRTPADYNNATGNNMDREEVADAIKDHLGVNLASPAFEEDENGESRWTINMLHKDPPVFSIENFFTKEECQSYMSMVEPSDANEDEQPKAVRITSPTFSSHSISRRTSTTWFCRYDGVPTLLAKAQQLLDVELNQMEEPQIVRYRTGEEFSWHYDEIPSTQLSNGGQRLATLLVYLNDLEEGRGGGTVFRDLAPPRVRDGGRRSKRNKVSVKSSTNQLTVRPKTGTALVFFPSYKDGTPDARTLHKGEVALDTKMIAQLWIHERGYRAGVPEGNLQTDALEGVRREAERLGFS